jgi:hypothetical protein
LKASFFRTIGLVALVATLGRLDADGVHFSDAQIHLQEPTQKAAITWDGKTETLVLASAVRAEQWDNMAWVLPIPSSSRPKVTASDAAVFQILTRYMQELADARQAPAAKRGFKAAPPAMSAAVQELSSEKIDIYDITVLKAASSKDLSAWLESRHLKVPEGAAALFAAYIGPHGGYFVVNRLDLANRYPEELKRLRARHQRLLREAESLTQEVNAALAQAGVPYKVDAQVGGSGTAFWDDDQQITAAICAYANGPENPLNLPPVRQVDLGHGLRVEERPAAERRFVNPPYLVGVPEKWCRVLKDGKPLGSLNVWMPEADGWMALLRFDKFAMQASLTGEAWKGRLDGRDLEALQAYLRDCKPYGWSGAAKNKRSPEQKGLEVLSPEQMQESLRPVQDLAEALGEQLGGRWPRWEQLRRAFVLRARYFQGESASSTAALLQEVSNSPYGMIGLEGLKRLSLAVRAGLETPLMIRFRPPAPVFPLAISSLGSGPCDIEVYAFAAGGVRDQHGVLKPQRSELIQDDLREELSDYLPLSGAAQVTRLEYHGDLAGLNQDAVLEAAPEVQPGMEEAVPAHGRH